MAKKIKDENGNVYVQKKPFYKRIWFILLVAIILISVFANMGSSTSTNKKTSNADSQSSSSSSSTKTSSESNKKTVYSVGQNVKVGDLEYVVNSKSTASNVGGEYGKDASGVYLILNVTVKNNGKKAVTVDSNFFKLIKGETEYSSDSSAGAYANEDAKFFLSEVNPGNNITGNVVFDVNQDVVENSDLQLQVQTGAWGTQTELININK
ncbi:hypothetical protein HMPREF9318_01009 [Streptococcus urinalis FB127-CNA-2]|uniref:Telomeric repeat-binding factor 2 n=1 Tax=Streptococcus urinalis 2285-97 TaxID=764291 RepID=G5KH73_9STRE|nr:DUF4352 domain-containing protein [Streptococcus urinalis]EHJ56030.1 telomeric repeat-binding factor 2 [Streptococcus urinalis 2285-97]EKS21055.1 hypothetical protein HMPREF9318_01009 [Streptococcus urinalis FB127-CNA-2]VEF31064.1 Telomeric repeat-binding factor 2 [Streptococcus urinalis]